MTVPTTANRGGNTNDEVREHASQEGTIRRTSITNNPDGKAWADRIKPLSPAERERRTAAVDVLLDKPDELNDILESELWTLREYLQGRSVPG